MKNALGTPINCSREPSSLAGEVEFQIQMQEVVECLPRNLPHSTLSNLREYRVQEFT